MIAFAARCASSAGIVSQRDGGDRSESRAGVNRGGGSVLALQEVIREGAQSVRPSAAEDGLSACMRAARVSRRASARDFSSPMIAGIGGLLCGDIFAGGLAEFLGRLRDVEDVVDDLKGEAERLAEIGERGELRRAWRSRSSRRGGRRW